jgi:hypothetical protein
VFFHFKAGQSISEAEQVAASDIFAIAAFYHKVMEE